MSTIPQRPWSVAEDMLWDTPILRLVDATGDQVMTGVYAAGFDRATLEHICTAVNDTGYPVTDALFDRVRSLCQQAYQSAIVAQTTPDLEDIRSLIGDACDLLNVAAAGRTTT